MEEIDACIVGFVLSCTTLIGPLVEKNRESISFCGLNLHGQSSWYNLEVILECL